MYRTELIYFVVLTAIILFSQFLPTAVLLPLDNFIKTGRFELNDVEQTLILIGIACSIFYDNSRTLKLIYKSMSLFKLCLVF